MTQLSESERREAQAAAAQAMVGDAPAAAAPAGGADLGDVKEFFCKNWPMIKKVLEFIADKVGGGVGRLVRAVIAAGDVLHKLICKD